MTKLPGLNDVDWSSLSHAYGRASNVPALLGELADGKPPARKRALAELDHTIHHQFNTYSASAAAAPFLVMMALDSGRDDRAALLELLAGLAVGEPDEFDGVDIRDDFDRGRVAMLEGGLATYEAVRGALPQLTPLLEDKDPSVRIATAYLAAQFADSAKTSLVAVRRALASEKDAKVRISQLLALRLLARFADDKTDVPLLEKTIAKKTGKDGEAVAAALALARLVDSHAAAKKILSDAQSNPKGSFVWGDVRRLARRAVGEAALQKPLPELVAWLESKPVDDDPMTEERILWYVVMRTLSRHGGSYRLAEDVPELTRRAIAGAIRRGDQTNIYSDRWLHHYGLPPNESSLARWVGVEPPGLLEKVVSAGRRWPVWKWLKAASLGEVTHEEAVAAVSSALEPKERGVLLRDPFLAEYDLEGNVRVHSDVSIEADAAQHSIQTLMVELLSTAGAKVVEAEAARALPGARDRGKSIHPVVLLVTLARLSKQRGEPLDEKWFPLFPFAFAGGSAALFREAVEAAPAKEREKIVLGRAFGAGCRRASVPTAKTSRRPRC